MNAAAEITWMPKDSETELDPLFEYAPFVLAQCQVDGHITALNPALKQMLGRTPDVQLPFRFGDLIQLEDRAEAERLLGDLFGRQRESFQIDSQSMDASRRPVQWTVWRVTGENGHPDSAMAMAEDLPRNPEAEQRLRHAERLEAVGRLAGGVAHDFNNLLTGVLLYCDLLLAHIEPCHRVRKYAEEIRKAGMQATGLVRQLLAVARPTNSEPRLLSLNEIAEGMRNLLVRLIGENIQLKFQLDPNLGLVKMDPTQCQQILLNLALNARDAMPDGGQITIETSNCKVQVLTEPRAESAGAASLPCALFVIADNGSGMDDATRAHLFEAFFTTKAGKGTGLGLATVRDIVTSSGGLIHVDSALQRGTRVSVLLPLVPLSIPDSGETSDFHPETNRAVFIPK
jgi:two-component system, cell cycle sensor histidine kinase and response regulator CckA